MTMLEIIALLISGLPTFDAVCMSLGTAGTGGFGLVVDSAASYTALQQVTLRYSWCCLVSFQFLLSDFDEKDQ